MFAFCSSEGVDVFLRVSEWGAISAQKVDGMVGVVFFACGVGWLVCSMWWLLSVLVS